METEKANDFDHTGPGTLAGRLLRRSWHPIYRSSELKPGRTAPIVLMSEELTLYRGEDGTPHIVESRCAHRGVPLHVGRVEGNCIRCRYHGWKYDAGGQCVDQPAERKSWASKVQIKSYPVEEYFGLIWTYLGEGTPPELPRYPELEPYGFFIQEQHRKWNYFHDLENTLDDLHQRWVHPAGVYQDEGQKDEIPDMKAEETEYGIVQRSVFSNGYERRLHLLMPNVLHFITEAGPLRGYKSLLYNVPVDDQNHKMFFLIVAAHMTPDAGKEVVQSIASALKQLETSLPDIHDVIEEVLSGRRHWEDLEFRPDRLHIEDGIVLRGQGIISDRSKNRLGSSDAAIMLLRRVLSREMVALRDEKPLTSFKTPPTLHTLFPH